MTPQKTFLQGPYSKVVLFSLCGLIGCALVIGPLHEFVRAADTYVIAANDVTPPKQGWKSTPVKPLPKQGWKSTPVKPPPKQGWKSTPVKPPPKQGWKSSPSPKTAATPKAATAVNTPKKSSGNVQTSATGVKPSPLPKPSGSTIASKKETIKTSPKQGLKSTKQSGSTYVNATGEVVPLPKGMKTPPKQGWKSSPSPGTSTTPKTAIAVSTSRKLGGESERPTSGTKALPPLKSFESTAGSGKEMTKVSSNPQSKSTPQSIASLEGRQIELNRKSEISKLDSQLQELDRLKSKYGGRDSAWDQRASDAEDRMRARKAALEKQSEEWGKSHPSGAREGARQNVLESRFKRISKEYGEVSRLEAKLNAKTSLTNAEERKLREYSKKADELMKEMLKTNEELNSLTGERKILVEDERGNYGTFLRGEGYQGEARRARGK